MAICELCKKKTVVGRRSKHKRGVASAKFSNKAKKVSRFFRPNLQRVTRELDGHKVSGLFCTACIRKMKQSEKIREEETKEREKKKGEEIKTVKSVKTVEKVKKVKAAKAVKTKRTVKKKK